MTAPTHQRLPDAFLTELRARVDLSVLIGRDVKLIRNGREYKGLCPFHSEKTPSFTVVPSKGFYHCFGCGANGDALSWMQEARGLEFMAAVEALADMVGLDVPGRRRDPSRPVSQGRPLAPVVAAIRPEDEVAREERTRRALYATWRQGVPVPGTPAEVYLTGRGIAPTVVARLQAIRFAEVDYWHRASDSQRGEVLGRWPCMIAAITGPDGRFCGLHQTYLADGGRGKRLIVAPDGEVLPTKKVRGTAGGGAIRLTPLPEECTDLGGAEGIETAASVIQGLGDGAPPIWALYSLGNLGGGGTGRGGRHPKRPGQWLPSVAPDPNRPGFVPPSSVQRFTWWADGDGKDPASADCLIKRGAVRYQQRGIAFRLAKAPPGRDWNDVLQHSKPEGAGHE